MLSSDEMKTFHQFMTLVVNRQYDQARELYTWASDFRPETVKERAEMLELVSSDLPEDGKYNDCQEGPLITGEHLVVVSVPLVGRVFPHFTVMFLRDPSTKELILYRG
jgi:hypothetical protein